MRRQCRNAGCAFAFTNLTASDCRRGPDVDYPGHPNGNTLSVNACLDPDSTCSRADTHTTPSRPDGYSDASPAVSTACSHTLSGPYSYSGPNRQFTDGTDPPNSARRYRI